MAGRTLKIVVLLVGHGLYWQLVCSVTDVNEPWDSDAYWRLWYPLSLLSAAIAGYFVGSNGWLAGGVITFAQLPVMWINNGTGPLVAVGLIFIGLLAVPAVAISLLTGRYRMRHLSS